MRWKDRGLSRVPQPNRPNQQWSQRWPDRRGAMSRSLEEHIAECYRRAAEYKRLHRRASSWERREILWSTRQRLLLLANELEGQLGNTHRPHIKGTRRVKAIRRTARGRSS